MYLKRPQYSMRSLFVLMTVMACLLGWLGWQHRSMLRQREKALTLARQASDIFDESLHTAVASGTFREYQQPPGAKKPTLRTEAKLSAFFDRGKYHIRADFQKRLRRVRVRRPGADPQWSDRGLVDSKPDALFIVHDGAEAVMVEESARILQDGYRRSEHPDVNSAASLQGIPWGDLMRLGQELADVDRLVENLTEEEIELVDLASGGIQLRYHMKNSPQVRAEIDISRASGYHVTARRVYNPGQPEPASEITADWRQLDGVWYVHGLTQRQRRRGGSVTVRRFEFDQFTMNPTLEPWLFTIDSVEYQTRTATEFARHFAGEQQ